MSLLESPEIWNSVPLEDLLLYVIGGDWGTAPDYQEQGYQTVACIRGSEFRHWTNESGRTAVPRKVKANSLDKRALLPGDILLEISGGGPDQPVGRTVLINRTVLNQFDTPVIGTNFLRLLRPSAALDQRFLNQYLEFFYSSGEVVRYQGGSNNLRNLKFKEYSQISVPLPPLAEQKIIADKLDTLLAQVENTKARLERIPQILKRFRQSVLAAAVSGRLTEDWRSDRPIKKPSVVPNKRLPKIEYNDYYGKSIDLWEWCRLGSLVDLINGDRGKNYPNKSEYVEHGIPFINTGHINPNGTLSSERMNFITEQKYNSLGGGKTQPSDLVYCLRGATMGKTARVEYEVGAIASSLVIVRPKEVLARDFAYYFLISPQARDLISLYDNGSAQPNLSAKSLASFPLQLPSLEEQTEVVRRVDQLFTHADRIEQQINKALARVNDLTQSTLAKAFRGELTEQWRKDNPELISGENSAEALLERIKTERAAAKPAKKTRKQTTA